MTPLATLAIAIAASLLTLLALALWRLTGAFRRSSDYRLLKTPSLDSEAFVSTLASFAEAIPTRGEIAHIWTDIDEIQQVRLNAIASAQRSIQFETFMMDPGTRADAFAEAICERARAGVRVYLLVDDYGTENLPAAYWHRLENAGAEVRRFNPFHWRSPLNYLSRTHRKLLIIDGDRAFIGGTGISDDWDVRPGDRQVREPWCDLEFQVNGKAVDILCQLYARHWVFANGVVDLGDGTWECQNPEQNQSQMAIASGSDPTYHTSSILGLMQSLASSATHRFWISSPYFLPNANLIRTLVLARQRGVDVRVLTMGEHTDKPFVRDASREDYGKLLDREIDLYEYQPSMMHAKLILADESWVNFGSANVDARSLFHNEELNVLVRDRQIAARVEAFFKSAFDRSQRVLRGDWQRRPYRERLRGRLALIFRWQL